jgi:hypothetical protein
LRVGRQLYGELARVAVANIFFDASIIMIVMTAIDKTDWLAQAFPIFFLGTSPRKDHFEQAM